MGHPDNTQTGCMVDKGYNIAMERAVIWAAFAPLLQ
jgi:hypothetical protein